MFINFIANMDLESRQIFHLAFLNLFVGSCSGLKKVVTARTTALPLKVKVLK